MTNPYNNNKLTVVSVEVGLNVVGNVNHLAALRLKAEWEFLQVLEGMSDSILVLRFNIKQEEPSAAGA